jgi:hypothetical protein
MLGPTDSRPVYLGVKPHLGPKTRFFSVSCGLMWGTLCDERADLSVTICYWPTPARSFSGRSSAGLMIVFVCLRLETPSTWRARSPYSYPPRNRVVWLYPQALGSLFVASRDSQGYGEGIRPRLHTGLAGLF